jgi:hypothetical protein
MEEAVGLSRIPRQMVIQFRISPRAKKLVLAA